MVPASLLWAAAQIRAFGQVLSASSGVPVATMITVAAAIVIAYTAFGGMLADAWTDLVQGVVLVGGLVVLFVSFVSQTGTSIFSRVPTGRLDVFPDGASLLSIVEAWSIPVCGSVVAAELVSRVISARSPEIARRSSLLAGFGYLLLGIIPVAIGLAGAVILP